MGLICDFCKEQRSMVYCRFDYACLCLLCDRKVHSANALSQRHTRTLLCDRCKSEPAKVRCLEENLCFCQRCDTNEHSMSVTSSGHKKQKINCYSGCPSSTELSRIWYFIPEFPLLADSNCEQVLGPVSISSPLHGPWIRLIEQAQKLFSETKEHTFEAKSAEEHAKLSRCFSDLITKVARLIADLMVSPSFT